MQQCLHFLPKDKFEQIVGQHKADRGIRTFSCWNQLSVMLYAQATCKETLREIETGLKYNQINGIIWINQCGKINNCRCKWKEELWAFSKHCFMIYFKGQKNIFLKRNSISKMNFILWTVVWIDLCLSLFNWAKFRKKKGAIKLHTLLNNKSQIPEFLQITTGKEHEVKIAQEKWKEWNLPKESILVVDRGILITNGFMNLVKQIFTL